FEIRDTGSMKELVEKINSETGGKVKASLNDDGKLVLSSDTGARITVAYTGTDDTSTGLAADTYDPRLSLSSTDGTGITVEYDDGADASILGIDARSDAGDITGQDVTVNSAL